MENSDFSPSNCDKTHPLPTPRLETSKPSGHVSQTKDMEAKNQVGQQPWQKSEFLSTLFTRGMIVGALLGVFALAALGLAMLAAPFIAKPKRDVEDAEFEPVNDADADAEPQPAA